MARPVPPSVLAITGFALAFLVVFWFLVLPALGELHDAKEAAALAARTRTVTTTRSVTEGSEVVATRERVLALLPAEDESFDLALQVETLARSIGGLTLTSFALSNPGTGTLPRTSTAATASPTAASSTTSTAKATPKPSAPVKKVPFTVALSGRYSDVQRFIRELTVLGRFIEIDQATIAPVVVAGTSSTTTSPSPTAVPVISDQVTLQLTAFAYSLVGSTGAATTTATAPPSAATGN